MDSFKDLPNETVPDAVSLKILDAICGALKEEKVPLYQRLLKVSGATLLTLFVFGLPFVASFRGQLSSIWITAIIMWGFYFLIGFSLLFYPQPRIMVRGVWSPFVVARLLLAATASTILQILICPSFVYLDSPLSWNPLNGMTHSLMRVGGMNLCMFFCGFLFSTVSGWVGILSVRRVAVASYSSTGKIFLILLGSQAPIFLIQVLTPSLVAFALAWTAGIFSGFSLVVLALRFIPLKVKPSKLIV